MRRTGRLSMVIGLLLLVVIIVAGYLYLSGGLDLTGEPLDLPPTPIPTMQIVVARRVIPVDTVLKPDYVEENFETKMVTVTVVTVDTEIVIVKKSQLYNKVAIAELDLDVFLREDQFVDASLSYLIPPGKRAFPLLVDRYSGVVGKIVRDDSVDVIVSGQIELHFPKAFPVEIDPLTLIEPLIVDPISLLSVKTVLQGVQVLEVIVLTRTAEPEGPQPTPTPLPEGVEAPEEEPGLPITWIVILAVEDQQAEVLQFAVDQGMKTQLLLRPRGDEDQVATRGITTWILVETYGLPVPRHVPYQITPGSIPGGTIP